MRRMVSRMLAALAAGVLFFLMPGCNGAPENPSSDPNSVHGGLSEPEETDQPELRGVWVSYMELNTLLSGRTAQEAKTELDTLLDNCVSWHLNAVFFHVRANSDAYYASEIFAPAPAVASLLEGGLRSPLLRDRGGPSKGAAAPRLGESVPHRNGRIL